MAAYIENILQKGPYLPDWDSLACHKTPEWFGSAKFGVFIHWGLVRPDRAKVEVDERGID